jgi:hypothetical protein
LETTSLNLTDETVSVGDSMVLGAVKSAAPTECSGHDLYSGKGKNSISPVSIDILAPLLSGMCFSSTEKIANEVSLKAFLAKNPTEAKTISDAVGTTNISIGFQCLNSVTNFALFESMNAHAYEPVSNFVVDCTAFIKVVSGLHKK